MQDGLQLEMLEVRRRGVQQGMREVRRGARMPQALEGAVRVQRVPVENHAHMQASLLVLRRGHGQRGGGMGEGGGPPGRSTARPRSSRPWSPW